MTSLPRPIGRSIDQTAEPYSPSGPVGRNICLIVGLTCLVGFLVDTLVLGTPPQPFNLQWRIGFLQQAGDRSIILLFAIALLLFSLYAQKQLRRSLGFFCLALGVAFLLSCVLVIRDSLLLQRQALETISLQEEQIQTQIEEAQSGELELSSEVSPEQLQQASQQLSSQATSLKENARQGITKAGVASMGNLTVVGLGMIGLGRLGIKRR